MNGTTNHSVNQAKIWESVAVFSPSFTFFTQILINDLLPVFPHFASSLFVKHRTHIFHLVSCILELYLQFPLAYLSFRIQLWCQLPCYKLSLSCLGRARILLRWGPALFVKTFIHYRRYCICLPIFHLPNQTVNQKSRSHVQFLSLGIQTVA